VQIGAVYKVTIRQTGNGTISKTFPTKKSALEFSRIAKVITNFNKH